MHKHTDKIYINNDMYMYVSRKGSQYIVLMCSAGAGRFGEVGFLLAGRMLSGKLFAERMMMVEGLLGGLWRGEIMGWSVGAEFGMMMDMEKSIVDLLTGEWKIRWVHI